MTDLAGPTTPTPSPITQVAGSITVTYEDGSSQTHQVNAGIIPATALLTALADDIRGYANATGGQPPAPLPGHKPGCRSRILNHRLCACNAEPAIKAAESYSPSARGSKDTYPRTS